MYRITHIWRVYLLPGIVFLAVLSGGGYASGQEIMQYCIKVGRNGVYVIIVVFVGFWVFLFLTAQLARATARYDYRSFAGHLLGRWWWLFEALFIVMALLAIAVVGAAASEVLSIEAGMPYFIASFIVIVGIGILTFFGKQTIEKYDTIGTVLLYVLITSVCVKLLSSQPKSVVGTINAAHATKGWIVAAFTYVSYNVVVIPACLFTFQPIRKSSQALASSIIASVLGVLPIAMVYISLLDQYEVVKDSAVPFFDAIHSVGNNVYVVG